MNRNQRLLTAFLGGLVGILLSGYAYYFTHEQHYWLLPIGVFLGSAVGYCFANAKAFFKNAANYAHLKKSSTDLMFNKWKKKVILLATACYHDCKSRLKKFGPTFIKAMRWIGTGFAKMATSAMTMHPVTKALIMRTVTSLIFFAGAGYSWITQVIPSDTIAELFSKGTNNHDQGFFSVLVVFSLLSLFANVLMSTVMNISNTFDDQASFFREYEKYNNKLTMTVKNLASDLAMFIVSQLIAVALFAILMVGMGYVVVFGAITMLCLMFILCSVEYAKAMKKHGVFVTFVTTLVITSICYFIFKSLFANQIVIWTVALCSGSLCGLVCHSLEGYLKRFDSVEVVDDRGHDFLDKVFNATLGYIPKKLWQLASPHVERFGDFVRSKDILLARL